MKRLLVCAIIAVLVLAVATTAIADKMGAIKADIYVTESPETIVGWAILNTNADGMLVVTVHVDDAEPDEVLPVYVKIEGVGLLMVGEITINKQGKGTCNGKVELPEGLESLIVRAQIKNLTPPPINKYKSDPVEVPLK
ncbi:MAG: hypothetical protein JXA52_00080 [Planctomycetes bacterium]|nr:hypothetical protein [Planctomycetota bacterium]